jgi:hypothetical protein
MRHYLGWLAAAACAASLAAASWIGFGTATTPTPEPGLGVETNADLGNVPLGESKLTFTVTNPAGRPRRVLGVVSYCNARLCVMGGEPPVLVVPAGGKAVYTCTLALKESGPFEAKVTLFLEESGTREATFTVRGVGVPEGQADALPD